MFGSWRPYLNFDISLSAHWTIKSSDVCPEKWNKACWTFMSHPEHKQCWLFKFSLKEVKQLFSPVITSLKRESKVCETEHKHDKAFTRSLTENVQVAEVEDNTRDRSHKNARYMIRKWQTWGKRIATDKTECLKGRQPTAVKLLYCLCFKIHHLTKINKK